MLEHFKPKTKTTPMPGERGECSHDDVELEDELHGSDKKAYRCLDCGRLVFLPKDEKTFIWDEHKDKRE